MLKSGQKSEGGEYFPRSLNMALDAMPDANLVCISVPGEYARHEGSKAIEKGLHVLLFSSNVSVHDELELKKSARQKGVLMMGPDCGTSIINGVILGFGNIVRRGPIGIIAASGTGIHEIIGEQGMMESSEKKSGAECVALEAEPETIRIDLRRTAVMVIDMQNAFINKGGMFDLWGLDISSGQNIIAPIKRINQSARAKGIRVIYTMACFSNDLHDAGNINSPARCRNRTLVTYQERPDVRERLTVRGTWGSEIIQELQPETEDIVVPKQRFSAFFGTNLDIILRSCNIKYLAFTGVATNICVEATLRDAYYLDYFPILISDACANAGPPLTQEATIFNVKFIHGWVTSTESFLKATT